MTYDVQLQAQKAIATLQAKQARIIHKTKTKRYHYDYYCPIIITHFNHHCDRIRRIVKHCDISIKTHWIKSNSTELAWDAITYVKLECLIKRLENGEDPRRILYEVVSDGV